MLLSKLVVFLIAVVAVFGYEKSYKGHSVLRCSVKDEHSMRVVYHFCEAHLIDVWRVDSSKGEIDVNLSPQQKTLFSSAFSKDLKCEVFIEDLEGEIQREKREMVSAENKKSEKNGKIEKKNSFFDNYQSYEEMQKFLQGLQNNGSGIVSVIQIGTSTLGVPILGVQVNGGPDKRKRAEMPTIYFQAGQHAREWIAPATLLYILNGLVEGYGNDSTITRLVDDINWIFIPMVNPDGYNYSRNVDRMWRKNRRPPPQGSTCIGVDTNRNWPAYWNRGGSSTNPCSDTYMGISAGSEREVNNVVSFFRSLKNVKIATDWHSYGQYYLFPWGWTTNFAPDHQVMLNLGNKVADAIRQVDSRIYTVGSSARLLYIASGGFDDFTYADYNVTFSQTLEVRDTGRYGFILPASEIVPCGKENLRGVIVQALSILGL